MKKKEKRNKEVIPIMFCFDTNYVIPAAVAFYSLMKFADKNYFYEMYILHSNIKDWQIDKLNETLKEFDNCRLNFVDMNNRLDEEWKKSYRGDHFTKEVMYKLLTASLFPQYDKLVVSDVDVVFLGDIAPSYFMIDSNKDKEYIAGVKPIGKVKDYLKSYINQWSQDEIDILGETCGGYLVMNLKRIREEGIEKKFMDSLEKNAYRLNQMEQDILNIVCEGKIKHLPLKYVACTYIWDYFPDEESYKTDANYSAKEIKDTINNPVQLHYATSIKPWKNTDCTLGEIWYQYLAKTPFFEDHFKKLPNTIIVSEEICKERNQTII